MLSKHRQKTKPDQGSRPAGTKLALNLTETDAEREARIAERADRLPRMAYTMAETAQLLGVSYITIWRLLKRGLLRSSTALRHKLVPASEIERFLKATLE